MADPTKIDWDAVLQEILEEHRTAVSNNGESRQAEYPHLDDAQLNLFSLGDTSTSRSPKSSRAMQVGFALALFFMIVLLIVVILIAAHMRV